MQAQRSFQMKKLDVIAVILLIVGGLNWGLVGLFHFDLVAAIFGMKFGQTSWLSSAVYVLVALSALIKAVGLTSGQPVAVQRQTSVRSH
jgi:uncharacterized membrane protein YuzA (DUF378 family)